jgi:hypothetical protein
MMFNPAWESRVLSLLMRCILFQSSAKLIAISPDNGWLGVIETLDLIDRGERTDITDPQNVALFAIGIAKSVLTRYSFIREVIAAEGVIVRRVEAIHGKTIGAENNSDDYGK